MTRLRKRGTRRRERPSFADYIKTRCLKALRTAMADGMANGGDIEARIAERVVNDVLQDPEIMARVKSLEDLQGLASEMPEIMRELEAEQAAPPTLLIPQRPDKTNIEPPALHAMLTEAAATVTSAADDALAESADTDDPPTQNELAAWIGAGNCPPETLAEVAERLAVQWGLDPGKVRVAGWAFGGLVTWRDGVDVSVRQLVDDFARYSYLPRLSEPAVLLEAIRNGLSLMTWEQDSFAYADGYDDGAGRYRGLQSGPRGALTDSDPGLLVRPEVARKQMDVEAVRADKADEGTGTRYAQKPGEPEEVRETSAEEVPASTPRPAAKRYHGAVRLDPTRVGRDAGQVADEVIAHLAGLQGADVRLTLEIEANIPDGAPEQVVRTVTENSRTLHFDDSGFETE